MRFNFDPPLGDKRRRAEAAARCPLHDFRPSHRGAYCCERCGVVFTAPEAAAYGMGVVDGRRLERIAREVAEAKAREAAS